jgi:hypothetical protein
MKASEIEIGGVYKAKVSRSIVKVKVTNIRETKKYRRAYSGATPSLKDGKVYDVLNLATNRTTTFRSAAKFRERVVESPKAAKTVTVPIGPQPNPWGVKIGVVLDGASGGKDMAAVEQPKCPLWVEDGVPPVSQRCRLPEGHEGPCCGLTIGVTNRMGWEALKLEYDTLRKSVPDPATFDEWLAIKKTKMDSERLLLAEYARGCTPGGASHPSGMPFAEWAQARRNQIEAATTKTLIKEQAAGGPETSWAVLWESFKMEYEAYTRGVTVGKPLQFNEWWSRVKDQPHKLSVTGTKPEGKTTVTVEPRQPKPEPTNLVQWIPRDPVTGSERLRIKCGDVDREYLILDQLHLPVRVLHLEYLDKDYQTVIRSVRFGSDRKLNVAIGCTCPDFTQRRHLNCKHMRALNAAMPTRPRPITFG